MIKLNSTSSQDMKDQIRKLFVSRQDYEKLAANDLISVLGPRSDSRFTMNHLNQIFLTSNLDPSKPLYLVDFVSAYAKHEGALQEQLLAIKSSVKDLSQSLTTLRRELIESKANKSPEDNNLLTIILKQSSEPAAYKITARIICEEWEVTSNQSTCSWNETFTFNTTSNDNLIIEFWKSGQETLETQIGSIEIPLNTVKNEQPIEKWFKVLPTNKTIQQVLLKVHWVSNKVEYIEGQVKETEEKLKNVKIELEKIEENLEKTLAPLGKVIEKVNEIDSEISKGIDKFFVEKVGKNFKWNLAYWAVLYCFLSITFVGMAKRVEIVNVGFK